MQWGPTMTFFIVKTNKSQRVILSIPALLTAGQHSRQPSESQGGHHADGNKVALSSLYASVKSKHVVRLALVFDYSQLTFLSEKQPSECHNVMNKGLAFACG